MKVNSYNKVASNSNYNDAGYMIRLRVESAHLTCRETVPP